MIDVFDTPHGVPFFGKLLLRAVRQKMLNDELDAASAASEVGDESPSQFIWEYKRFFGLAPMRDSRFGVSAHIRGPVDFQSGSNALAQPGTRSDMQGWR